MPPDNRTTYVAFLRGINVGGRKRIKMAELREIFEGLGFEQVKTLQAAGNVLFTFPPTELSDLRDTVESGLADALGYDVNVLLRTHDDIRQMVESDPFAEIGVTSDIRLYVSFLSDEPASNLEIPYASEDGNYRILDVSNKAIFSVLTLTAGSRSVDLMSILEKEFGSNLTTRNWNTVAKVAALRAD